MRLYDSLSRQIVELAAPDVVDMYVCGVTPYDATHLGHAAVFVTFDLLHRHLASEGREVRMVRNVTDIDAPLFRRAQETGEDYRELAMREEAQLMLDLDRLSILPPWSTPRASGALGDIHDAIRQMLDNGAAYIDGRTVYFSAATSATFGELSRLSSDAMLEIGVRRGEDPADPAKRHPLDFVLWRPSDLGEPEFPSEWGPGLPGWHIECTAMIRSQLGGKVFIHGGGSDLIYPHHECELAQSASLHAYPLAQVWMHQAMVGLDGHKMSKSRGNLIFVRDLLRHWEPCVVRAMLLDNHYRVEWTFNDSMLAAAAERVQQWRSSSGRETAPAAARKATADSIANDLDSPSALAIIDRYATEGFDVSSLSELLGIFI